MEEIQWMWNLNKWFTQCDDNKKRITQFVNLTTTTNRPVGDHMLACIHQIFQTDWSNEGFSCLTVDEIHAELRKEYERSDWFDWSAAPVCGNLNIVNSETCDVMADHVGPSQPPLWYVSQSAKLNHHNVHVRPQLIRLILLTWHTFLNLFIFQTNHHTRGQRPYIMSQHDIVDSIQRVGYIENIVGIIWNRSFSCKQLHISLFKSPSIWQMTHTQNCIS